jgi:hypothetical protein
MHRANHIVLKGVAAMKMFYMIPLASIGPQLSYKVWYATWSKTRPMATWSEVRPDVEPDDQTTWVVGVIQVDQTAAPPDGAIALGTGGKQVPPPPLRVDPEDLGHSGFQTAFKRWLTARSL